MLFTKVLATVFVREFCIWKNLCKAIHKSFLRTKNHNFERKYMNCLSFRTRKYDRSVKLPRYFVLLFTAEFLQWC